MKTDFLVIGSGIAGLFFALKASTMGEVTVVTKKKEVDTATNLAQGGIAAVIDKTDDFKNHIKDTLLAGDGLCDNSVVEMVVKDGPARIKDLIDIGVNFQRDNNGLLSLGREGGHSHRRVAHSYDLTGREIERALVEKIDKSANVSVLENQMCVDLIVKDKKCIGAYILDEEENIVEYRARFVVLCTGGAGKVYLYTSNPEIATGDGIAIAHRAGAEIKDMEFVQFHPTCLYHHNVRNFLISEAVRGEGAKLLNENGERFMARYEPEKMELATRDKVARAIDSEMKKSGQDCVYLDITEKSKEYLQRRFPTIFNKCKSLGIDISKEPIPVVPAAHYLCGGVVTDKDGKTTIENLLALGETARTGLHGANRLASNSLLEAVVYANRAYKYCETVFKKVAISTETNLEKNIYKNNTLKPYIEEEILVNHNWDVLRRIMWNYVGIVRKKSRLELADLKIEEIKKEITRLLVNHRLTPNMLELRNLSIVSQLIIESALKRDESIGLHYLSDEK